MGRPTHKRQRHELDYELDKRKVHLKPYAADYKRVFDLLYNVIIDQTKDIDGCIFAVRYAPRARTLQIGLGWKREDAFPRSTGFFTLWRDGIFYANGDIEMWPKVKCNVPDYRRIPDMTDDEIVERMLTCMGVPWVDRFGVAKEAGALRHDTKRLIAVIETIKLVAPHHHQREVNDIMDRIKSFGSVVGA